MDRIRRGMACVLIITVFSSLMPVIDFVSYLLSDEMSIKTAFAYMRMLFAPGAILYLLYTGLNAARFLLMGFLIVETFIYIFLTYLLKVAAYFFLRLITFFLYPMKDVLHGIHLFDKKCHNVNITRRVYRASFQ